MILIKYLQKKNRASFVNKKKQFLPLLPPPLSKKEKNKKKTKQSNFRHLDFSVPSRPSPSWTCQENRSLVSEFDLTNSRFQTINAARLIRRDANRFPR